VTSRRLAVSRGSKGARNGGLDDGVERLKDVEVVVWGWCVVTVRRGSCRLITARQHEYVARGWIYRYQYGTREVRQS
jgi:hypothetical protein